ncbi:hypothetical protein E2562_011078, partial [Oryza meyeriana var. granulata]
MPLPRATRRRRAQPHRSREFPSLTSHQNRNALSAPPPLDRQLLRYAVVSQ